MDKFDPIFLKLKIYLSIIYSKLKQLFFNFLNGEIDSL